METMVISEGSEEVLMRNNAPNKTPRVPSGCTGDMPVGLQS